MEAKEGHWESWSLPGEVSGPGGEVHRRGREGLKMTFSDRQILPSPGKERCRKKEVCWERDADESQTTLSSVQVKCHPDSSARL